MKEIPIPRTIPPITAPGKLSSPPITAATNPKINNVSKEFGDNMSFGVTKTPAIAPTPPAKVQPMVRIGPTRIPAKRAISGWNAEARSAKPKFVRWKIMENTIMTNEAPTITNMFNLEKGMEASPITKLLVETGEKMLR